MPATLTINFPTANTVPTVGNNLVDVTLNDLASEGVQAELYKIRACYRTAGVDVPADGAVPDSGYSESFQPHDSVQNRYQCPVVTAELGQDTLIAWPVIAKPGARATQATQPAVEAGQG